MTRTVLNLKFWTDDFLLILANFGNHNRFLNTKPPGRISNLTDFRLSKISTRNAAIFYWTLNSVSIIVSNATQQDKTQVPFIQFGGASLEERWFYPGIHAPLSAKWEKVRTNSSGAWIPVSIKRLRIAWVEIWTNQCWIEIPWT